MTPPDRESGAALPWILITNQEPEEAPLPHLWSVWENRGNDQTGMFICKFEKLIPEVREKQAEYARLITQVPVMAAKLAALEARAIRAEGALGEALEWMERTRACGDAGNRDWQPDSVYTSARALLGTGKGEEEMINIDTLRGVKCLIPGCTAPDQIHASMEEARATHGTLPPGWRCL
jgi:hypothetical protein